MQLDFLDLREAKYADLFDIKAGVYVWYFPIHVKHYNKNIDHAILDYYNNDYAIYCDINSKKIEDKNKREEAIIKSLSVSNIYNINFKNHEYTQSDKKKFFKSLFYLSILGNPLYVGKTERGEPLGVRIKEHIDLKTTFSNKLHKDLDNSGLTISNMLVLAIDTDKIFDVSIVESMEANFDKSLFLEKLLINTLSPKYNIKK